MTEPLGSAEKTGAKEKLLITLNNMTNAKNKAAFLLSLFIILSPLDFK
jgi:hypothetical protein